MKQVNSLLLKEIADAVNKEIDLGKALITVSYVDCAADLRNANVGISVLPENMAALAVKKLRSFSGALTDIIRKKTRLKIIPRFNWRIDTLESEAEKIEQILRDLKQ